MPIQQDLHSEKQKFDLKAKNYIGNKEKTEGLLKRAFAKATGKKDSLGNAFEKIQLLFELVRSWTKGEYKNVSTSTILTVIGAIIYFVSPIDFVPDFIAGLGIFDDAAVIAYTVKQISSDLEKFKLWKTSKPIEMKNPLD